VDFWAKFQSDFYQSFVEIWTKLQHEFYQSFIEGDRWLLYIKGLGTTLLVTVLALFLGVFLGVLVAVIRSAHDQQKVGKVNPFLKILNALCRIYVTVIRGTPMMVQLLIMYFVVFSSTRNQVGVAVLAFGINSGAYVSEIIRGGIMAVDSGQMEAGRSLGFNYTTTMRLIIIPQAVKMILPSLGNELITLLKETSIVTVIGLRDLTKAAMLVQSKAYLAFMPLIAIALVYLAIVMFLTWLVEKLERRLRTSER
jgi:His/Glu/Gln/Arg/opine family amino acid ABC transporter permease subunit